jgi:hypothetical protein
MIHCQYPHLIQRAAERCWSEQDVQGCVVHRNGEAIVVDPSHPAYPAKRKHGVGSHLKALLSRIGIKASEGCSCDKRACIMDANGPDWALANIQVVVGWLRDEAKARGLPFHDLAAAQLVKYAVRQARKTEKTAFHGPAAGT